MENWVRKKIGQTIVKKTTFLVKIEIFAQNRNFWSKSKFLVKIEIFGQSRNFWSKNRNFCEIIEM